MTIQKYLNDIISTNTEYSSVGELPITQIKITANGSVMDLYIHKYAPDKIYIAQFINDDKTQPDPKIEFSIKEDNTLNIAYLEDTKTFTRDKNKIQKYINITWRSILLNQFL